MEAMRQQAVQQQQQRVIVQLQATARVAAVPEDRFGQAVARVAAAVAVFGAARPAQSRRTVA
eukprot:2150358-Lingulodinium_polyedra.AAC.1